MSGLDVRERAGTRPAVSDGQPGDHERFSHYVPRRLLADAIVYGNAVRALCGKMWTPGRDPARFPTCPECKELFDRLPAGGGPGDPDA